MRHGWNRDDDVPGQGNDGLTQAQWNAILKKYGRRCLACGATDEKLHIDHVIPLSKGGGNATQYLTYVVMDFT